ncbi:MAG: hypothetical protein M1834_005554 [Cirrosporium novae-zelandiae]|nr:MAG: hypothetical protein M1834_005554 [Cirrosporium novae-zelandiae]
MDLFNKVKRVSKGPKTKASLPLGSAPAAEATTSEDPPQPIDAEVKPVEAHKPLGINVWSTGDREKTWTADNATEPWPKALLATDIPNARIITYGYDADVVHWMKPAGQNTVTEHAQNLVNDLCRLRARMKTSKRPILFVAHSLGGLVCQNALLLCVNYNDEAQGTCLDSTRGVAFMGTPNAGSDFEKFATAVANIISLSFAKAPNTQLLEVFKGHLQVLASIKNGFLTRVRRRLRKRDPEIKIHAFVEELPIAATGHVSIGLPP